MNHEAGDVPESTVASSNKPPILLWLITELVLLALVVGFVWAFESPGEESAPLWLSCLLGGLNAIIPHTYFAGLAWRHTGARAARMVVRSFYRGERGRFVLTLVGFGLIFISPLPVNPLAVLVSFTLVLALQIGLAARYTS